MGVTWCDSETTSQKCLLQKTGLECHPGFPIFMPHKNRQAALCLIVPSPLQHVLQIGNRLLAVCF